jgi:hypothetical protein
MHFSYYWVRARQDEQMREALTKQQVKKLRPPKRSIVSLLRARFDSFAVPDVLPKGAHDAKTTA